MINQSPQQSSHLKPLSASRLHVQRTETPRPVAWLDNPPSGIQSSGTDHMLTIRWRSDSGWADPYIGPYSDLILPPTASCLHYATQCYEGLKAYRGYDGRLRLFRPDQNCARLLRSARQVSLPSFDPVELEKLIKALLAIDGPRWLPAETCRGNELYVRPAMIANGAQIGVRLPEEALLFVIIVPWPKVDDAVVAEGLKLITSRADTIRAWPGGFGSVKVGANYGPNFLSLGEARAKGFDQVLWLFGENGMLTEAGSSNFFVVWRTPVGQLELVTASLEDGIILPGVTRRSVLDLVQKRLPHGDDDHFQSCQPLLAVERRFYMHEVEAAARECRLVEAFVTGTAYFVTPVSLIHWQGKEIRIPLGKPPHGLAGQFRVFLSDIMYGKTADPWSVEISEVSGT